ncbi:MAG: hypothetical protein QW035_02215 [Candidatus Anstonellales archaeon]
MIGLNERKAIHVAAGAGLMFLTYVAQPYLLPILFVLFIVFLLVMHESKEGVMKFLLPGLAAPTVNYVAGLCIALPLLEMNEFRAVLVALALSDSFAALFGKHHPIKRMSNGKSLGGAFAFFATCLLTFLFLPFPTFLIFALALSLIELLTPLDDNLTIPVSGAILLYFL